MSFNSLKGIKVLKDILGRKLLPPREPCERGWHVQANMGYIAGKERQVGNTSNEIKERKSHLEADLGGVQAI